MKFVLTVLTLVFLTGTAVPAKALTIHNKCDYPVAGSILSAENKVSMGQFRIAPGRKVRLLKGVKKTRMIIHMTPDVYNQDKLRLSKTEIDNPDSYIELKPTKNGIRVQSW